MFKIKHLLAWAAIAAPIFAQSQLTPNLQFNTPFVNAPNWNNLLNANFNKLDSILSGNQGVPSSLFSTLLNPATPTGGARLYLNSDGFLHVRDLNGNDYALTAGAYLNSPTPVVGNACTVGTSPALSFHGTPYTCQGTLGPNAGTYQNTPAGPAAGTGDWTGLSNSNIVNSIHGVAPGALYSQNNPTSGQIATGLGYTAQNAAVANANNDTLGAAAAAQAAAIAASDPVGSAATAQAAAIASSVQKAANLSDLASASTARTNLGLGTAATQPSTAFDAAGAAATAQSASAQKSANLSDLANAATARTNLGFSGPYFGLPTVNGDGTLNASTGALAVSKIAGQAPGTLFPLNIPAAGIVKSTGSGLGPATPGVDIITPTTQQSQFATSIPTSAPYTPCVQGTSPNLTFSGIPYVCSGTAYIANPGPAVGTLAGGVSGAAGANVVNNLNSPAIYPNNTTCVSANQPGANAGVQHAAALACLPSTGGAVDGSGITGAQTIATDIFSPVTKPVVMTFGQGVTTINANTTIGGNFTLNFAAGAILSPGIAATPTCTTTAVNSTTMTCSSIAGLVSGQSVRIANGIASGFDFFTQISAAPSGSTVTVANAIPGIITSQTVTARYTLTLSAASINAPPGQQIFDNSALGAYQVGTLDAVPYIGWLGADPTNANDSQPAFQAAAYASQNSSGAGVGCWYVPNGGYKLLTPVYSSPSATLCFIGMTDGAGQGSSAGPVISPVTSAFLEPPPNSLSAVGGAILRNLTFLGGTTPVEVGSASGVYLENLNFFDYSGFAVVYVGGVQSRLDTISCSHNHTNGIGCIASPGPVYSAYHSLWNTLGMSDTDGQLDHTNVNAISDYGSVNFKDQYLWFAAGGIANGDYSNFTCVFSCSTNYLNLNNVLNVHFSVLGTDGVGTLASPLADMIRINGELQYSSIEGFLPTFSGNSHYTNGLNVRGSWIDSTLRNAALGGDNVTTFGLRTAGTGTQSGSVIDSQLSYFSEYVSAFGRDHLNFIGDTILATNASGALQLTDQTGLGAAIHLQDPSGTTASAFKIIYDAAGTAAVGEQFSPTGKFIFPQTTLGIRGGQTCGTDTAQLRICGQLWTPPNTAPTLNTITPQTPGSTSYSYAVVAQYSDTSTSLISSTVSTATGAATLSTGNGNALSWTNPAGASCTNIWRVASSGSPSTTGLIASCVGGGSYTDIGAAGNGAAMPTTSTAGDAKIGGRAFAKVFSGPSVGSETVASSAAPTFSVATRASINTLTAPVTSFTLAAGFDGQQKVLTFCQNGTGNFPVTPPTNVHGFFTVGLTPSKCSTQSYTYFVGQSAWLAENAGVINQ